jgi:prepilin-type N-terminal cleavage/methylation domain-containing protein
MKKGFTLIEILLVFSLLAIVGGFCCIEFWKTKANQAVASSASSLQTVLTRAKNYAKDEREAKAWGVKKNDEASYQLMSGSPGSAENRQKFYLDSPTRFEGADWTVWFSPGEGRTGTGVTIVVSGPTGKTKKVKVSSSGLIEIE